MDGVAERARQRTAIVDPTRLLATGNWRVNIPVAQYLYALWSERYKERSDAGRNGRGRPKRPHTELIRRIAEREGHALFDVLGDDTSTGWDHYLNAPTALPIVDVDVDQTAEQVTFEYAGGERVTVGFAAVTRTVRRAKRR